MQRAATKIDYLEKIHKSNIPQNLNDIFCAIDC